MKSRIRQALQSVQNQFGEHVFINTVSFNSILLDIIPAESDELTRNLLNTAMCRMNAYTRLKNIPLENMTINVFRLISEMNQKHGIIEELAQVVIECIAELFGYIPSTTNYLPSQPQAIKQSHYTSGTIDVGNILKFGDYDWRILEIQNGKALLLSDKVLEHKPYHNEDTAITWEQCTLRQYLNGEFLNKFSQADRSRISETKLSNPNNLWYNTNGGNDTFDKIFLLSLEDVDKYFGNSGDYLNKRRKNDELYIDNNGHFLSNIHNKDRAIMTTLWWWLRSPGIDNCHASFVGSSGVVYLHGGNFEYSMSVAQIQELLQFVDIIFDENSDYLIPLKHKKQHLGMLQHTNSYADNIKFPLYGGVRPALWLDLQYIVN